MLLVDTLLAFPTSRDQDGVSQNSHNLPGDLLGGGLSINTVSLCNATRRNLNFLQCCANLRFRPNLSSCCGRQVFTQWRQVKCPMCHKGISPSGCIQFLHQSRGFPFPDSFCARGTKRKSAAAFIKPPRQKTTFQSSRNWKESRGQMETWSTPESRAEMRSIHFQIVQSHASKVTNETAKAAPPAVDDRPPSPSARREATAVQIKSRGRRRHHGQSIGASRPPP